MSKNYKSDIGIYIFLACISILYVLIFSYCTSPLYPYYFGGDSAHFLTIGKAWYLGRLPYLDMFDHKGPFIYWIDMLGYALTNGQKYGVAFFQTAFMFFTTLSFYKISQLFKANKAYGVLVVLVTLLAMKRNYCSGNTVEEYCLPFISWSMLGIINYMKNIYREGYHSPKWSFLYGFTFGICFLTRITNFIPLCMGILFIIVYLIYKKEYKNLLQNIFAGIAGVLIIVLPFMVYFWQKNALYDCIYGTLLYNFEYAEGRKSWLLSADIKAVMKYFYDFFIAIIIFLSALVSLIKKEYRMALLYVSTGVLEQLLFLHGDSFTQYSLVCIAQIPIAINSVMSLSNKKNYIERALKACSIFAIIIFLIINILFTNDPLSIRRNFRNRTDRGWEQLIALIPEDQKDRFVVYGMNQFKELYLLENMMPCYKYYVIQEWLGDLSPETKHAIHDTFASKKAIWILTDSVVDNIKDILDDSYQLVDNTDKYYLYKLVQSTDK